jgi:hypothetical protein
MADATPYAAGYANATQTISRTWRSWVAFNATDMKWAILVVCGVVLAKFLT